MKGDICCEVGSQSDAGDCLGVFTGSPRLSLWHSKVQPGKPPLTTGCLLFLILGSVLALTGILTLVWKPVDILLNERLRMVRGLPAFDWWETPPDEVLLRAYVFNITNGEAFLSGQDEKLIVQEVGPFVFREKLYHTNVRFHDNGTMTYTATRKAIFLPEMNTLPLNETIIVANLAALGIPSYMWDANFVTRIGLNILINRMSSTPFIPITVDNYFWNFTDPLMNVARSIAPHLVPEENMGILHQIYRDFSDEVTVFVGPESGSEKFFKIDKWRGGTGLGKWENDNCDSVQGSSEGVSYHQNVKRTDVIWYLRKTICRAVPLYYSRDIKVRGMAGYRFDLPNTTFARHADTQEECYRQDRFPVLPSGLVDVSPCYYNFPIVSSFPHYMFADSAVTDRIEGLSPDWHKHGSAILLEPTTGIPFTAWARSQSSLYIHDMKGFPKLKKFSNMPIPMFWLEYKQVGLPNYITYLMYLVVNVLPVTQFYMSLAMIVTAFVIFTLIASKMFTSYTSPKRGSYSSVNTLSTNTTTRSDSQA